MLRPPSRNCNSWWWPDPCRDAPGLGLSAESAVPERRPSRAGARLGPSGGIPGAAAAHPGRRMGTAGRRRGEGGP